MADAQSDADKIRNKRLAKLGGGASSSTPPTQQPSSSAPSPPRVMTPPKTEQAEPRPSRITISQATPTPQALHPRSRQGGQLSLEAWEDVTLSDILKISLDPSHTTTSRGERLQYLDGVRSDLEAQQLPLRLNHTNLDQAIVEAGSAFPTGSPMKYMLGCWKRVVRHSRNVRNDRDAGDKLKIMSEVKRIIMSYCIFAATIPEMFNQESDGTNPLAAALLLDPDDEGGICQDFLLEATSRFSEDDSIKEALVGAMEQLSNDLSNLSMNDSFKPYVQALRLYSRHVPLVVALCESDKFLSTVTADRIEKDTLLGPFFRLSPLQGEVATNYFMGARARDDAFVRNSQDSLRLTLRSHQSELFDVVNVMFKSGQQPKERLLDWFAFVVNSNHKRRAFQVQRDSVSSDGFMINVTTILDRMCEPFMNDHEFGKVDRIEPEYFRRSPRVNIKDETKINADQNASDAFYAQAAPPATTNQFISEIFFLTVAAHHYGTEAANTKLDQFKKELKHLERNLADFENDRVKFSHNPVQLAQFEAALKKYKDRLETGNCVVNAITGVLLDEESQARSMLLMRYIIVWLLRLVQPGSVTAPMDQKFPRKAVTLPLPAQEPNVFKCLPEYFIEDIVDNFKFITSHIPWIIQPTQCEELLAMCITFLRSSEYIKNPGLKSGLVQILFYGVSGYRSKPKGLIGDLLNSSKFALEHLFHALMKFYIEAESTGSHTQFYDKFNIRYEIFQVIRCIWTNPAYRENLRTESKVNTAFFVRFVNLTLNDVTFLLDESFTAFKDIKKLQDELEAPEAASLEEKVREEKKELLETTQKRAKSWMQLTNETISMLKLFTEELADPFTSPEIVQRLADMLDYNLDSMVGPKQRDLKVRDAGQYGFKPLEMLSDLMSVYLNLKDKANFQLAVARDGRSYKHATLVHAADIMRKANTALKSPRQLNAFSKLADDIEATKQADDKAEEMLGEIPDEYTDPIMASLMLDPVILPISRQTVDRSTIMSHLLSDPHDPFNRTPLKIEDVIPDTELKSKIEEFMAEARERARVAIEEEQKQKDTTAMQTDEPAAETSLVESTLEAQAGKRKADDAGGPEGRDHMDMSEG